MAKELPRVQTAKQKPLSPSEDQTLFHIHTFAECLPLFAATCQDEHKELPFCKLSLQHSLLLSQLMT